MTVRDYGCCGGATASESSEKQWLRGDILLDLRAKSRTIILTCTSGCKYCLPRFLPQHLPTRATSLDSHATILRLIVDGPDVGGVSNVPAVNDPDASKAC